MCGFYCIAFIEYILEGKTLLDYTTLFSPNIYKKNDNIIYKYYKDKHLKSRIYTEKIYETKNYIIEEVKHNNLMSEKYEKTCRYLNYVRHLLVLASTITGCVSVSAFASLVCVPVGIWILQ